MASDKVSSFVDHSLRENLVPIFRFLNVELLGKLVKELFLMLNRTPISWRFGKTPRPIMFWINCL
jgi:hypothetical protein